MQPTRLRRARTHNLKELSVDLQEGELTCITGVSGSGKSSLALDTLYAEGQRRFVESFSPYARQFLERLERPPMESLEPVAAGVAVDRRAPVKSARSTVATLADVEAYLSALFTREAMPVCPACGLEAVRTDATTAATRLIDAQAGRPAMLGFPMRAGGTAEFLDVRERLMKDGYRRLLVEAAKGQWEPRDLEATKPSEAIDDQGLVHVATDRLTLSSDAKGRISQAIENGWKLTDGEAEALVDGRFVRLKRGLTCPGCAKSFEPPVAGLFSYQSPVGACSACRGFGRVLGIDWDKVTPDENLALAKGAIRPWNGKSSEWERSMLASFCQRRKIPMDVPWKKLTAAQRRLVIDGEGEYEQGKYPGVRAWFAWLETRTYKMHVRVLLSRYRASSECETCHGARLNDTALAYRVGGLHIGQWHGLELGELATKLEALQTQTGQGEVARQELASRVNYLVRVGLSYLTLDRPAKTLSGGEAQRVSLTAALGSSLTGALFVLDEPTVGLHPSDVPPLAGAVKELARRGNVTLVIEHDPIVIRGADRVLELGPGAGEHGGALVFDGTPSALAKRGDLATGRLLGRSGSTSRKPRKTKRFLQVKGARTNNLANTDVTLPLDVLCLVTGPSGSGKSTLVEEIVYRTLARARGVKDVDAPGPSDGIEGAESIKHVELVDQSPLGRTSRGNPATYVKAWDRIRDLFGTEPEAIERGLEARHFSFNVADGRCEACNGEGSETVEMQFLADVALTCPTCRGLRFKDEVLAVRHRGLTISDVLAMTVTEAVSRFQDDDTLVRTLQPLARLGLGYLALGQPLNTLSGGEAQRLKLARTLAADPRATLFVIDEPSAGLHDADVGNVVGALHDIVDAGGSVLVVDHDVTLMKAADWIVDLGPGAGRHGGRVVAEGTPDTVSGMDTLTGRALRGEYENAATQARSKGKVTTADGFDTVTSGRFIEVDRAREHNLRDVSCRIPLGKLVVFTGPSGSGKSSLAFDVIFAEGQRRFLETLTPYARQFLPSMPRPNVARISGIPPAVALEQRTSRAGGTSTVATVTEVAHYLRLLFAKLGTPHCPNDDTPITTLDADAVYRRITALDGRRTLLAPAVRARKGTYLDVFTSAARAGITHAIVDGDRIETDDPPRLQKTKEHDIDLVIHEGPAKKVTREQLALALRFGKGAVKVVGGTKPLEFSTDRTCPECGFGVPELDPRWFSFNTKQGRCDGCEGTGIEGGPEAVAEGATDTCSACEGTRLAPIPRGVRLEGRRYHEVVQRSVTAAEKLVQAWKFEGDRAKVGEASRGELLRRLGFLARVGLGYLSLDRNAGTLSGGEMQRLRLSAQLGAGLTGALYVLDEPTIGLHPRDTQRLIGNLRALVDTGSTVMVVEHDADTIRAADWIVDLGPTGGRGGGRIVAQGTPKQVFATAGSTTATALHAPLPGVPKRAKPEKWLELLGARANNLKDADLKIPHGRMTVVSGVSGSGKSTLVRQVLYPALCAALKTAGPKPGAFKSLKGLAGIKRVLAVDQSPIGRTPRSVPATYLDIWDEIRRTFANLPESKVKGYAAGRFSFNSGSGGRCAACDGQGAISHEMSFLPDVSTPCEACGGLRFDPPTLDVKFHGLSIGDVLKLSADEAVEVFAAYPKIRAPLECLRDLGVGYLQLGQGSNTLSGGEAQRMKLALELTAGTRHEPTLYVLDEPTTGLHLTDVNRLIAFLQRLVDRGDTLVVIEHHPSVIASADHVVELGPEGGDAGGHVVAAGTPAEVSKRATATGEVLRSLSLT